MIYKLMILTNDSKQVCVSVAYDTAKELEKHRRGKHPETDLASDRNWKRVWTMQSSNKKELQTIRNIIKDDIPMLQYILKTKRLPPGVIPA